MKEIRNYNSKGQYHGYIECYIVGTLIIKCFYNNGIPVYYQERYWLNGKLEKTYHI